MNPPGLDITRDSFESRDSKSIEDKTVTNPKVEPKESPRPKPAPVILPVGPDLSEKPKSPVLATRIHPLDP